jgi:hypothetical protein
MKKCSPCLAKKKMQIKTTLDSTSLLLEWQLLIAEMITNVGRDAEEKGTLIHCWWECKQV